MANTYYDGRFTEYLSKGKKYYKMATFGFVGLSMYLFINKNPGESKNLVRHATDLIKFLKKKHDFEITVSAYPETHPDSKSLEQEYDVLKKKIDSIF